MQSLLNYRIESSNQFTMVVTISFSILHFLIKYKYSTLALLRESISSKVCNFSTGLFMAKTMHLFLKVALSPGKCFNASANSQLFLRV